MQEYSTIAAVDLGSNSFRLQVARVVKDQLYPLDSIKETVRLAQGLTSDKRLDDESQERALNCLRRFGERLRGLPAHAVRAVGTNTFRVAKNARSFLDRAEEALGFPIDVIAGREEARLIYLGVAHGLPTSQARRLVVDIGGGSTECIVGAGLAPAKMDSLYMGCVSFSSRYFPDGRITKESMRQAEIAARMELETIKTEFSASHWDEAIGSSGTARALADILEQNGLSDEGITGEGMRKLRGLLIKAGDCRHLELAGLKADRVPVLPGGFAIMNAVFSELGIDRMSIASGALREGVLYDLLGRFHHHDMRDETIKEFMRRYHVDPAQARRVEALALSFRAQLEPPHADEDEERRLIWAARIHEVGISIAHSGYHKHSAYIVENADMPGFSKMEQAALGLLVRAQRGSLGKVQSMVTDPLQWLDILALRLAVVFSRSRMDTGLPAFRLSSTEGAWAFELDRSWLEANPLTEAALQAESKEWRATGLAFEVLAA